MPDVYGSGRFNSENKFGDKVSKARKPRDKSVARGCPNNDNQEHLYGAVKTIGIHTVENCRDWITYHVSCIFCSKVRNRRATRFGSTPNYEVYETHAVWLGERTGPFGAYWIKKSKTFAGNTNEKGEVL